MLAVWEALEGEIEVGTAAGTPEPPGGWGHTARAGMFQERAPGSASPIAPCPQLHLPPGRPSACPALGWRGSRVWPSPLEGVSVQGRERGLPGEVAGFLSGGGGSEAEICGGI